MKTANISNPGGAWPPWGLLQLSGGCANRIGSAYGDTNKKIRLEALNQASLVEEKVDDC